MKPDQTDIVAQLDTLRGEHATAVANVTKLTADLAAANAVAARVTNLEANLQAVTAERDTLKAENTRLSGESRDFNARVAAEVAKLGVRGSAVEKPAAGSTTETPESIGEQYAALTDPTEKAEFLAKHEKTIRSLLNRR